MTTFIAGMTSAGVAQELKAPTGLMCELLGSYGPVLIDRVKPSFSWICSDKQSAYAIAVSKPDGTGVWNSGKQQSSQSVNAPYRGSDLKPGKYTWRVRTWDETGKQSPWSEPHAFTVAGNSGGSSKGSPIDECKWVWSSDASNKTIYLRKTISISRNDKLSSAKAMLTADDAFTLTVNGKKIADTVGREYVWKTFHEIDLSKHLRSGKNVLAVTGHNAKLGAGLIGLFRISDRKIIFLDNTWKCRGRKEKGWDSASFDDSAWKPVKVLGNYGMKPWGKQVKVKTTATVSNAWSDRYPLAKTEIAPVAVKKQNGGWFIDFGKAAFGRIRFQATAKGGETVTLHLGERLVKGRNQISRKPGGTIRYRKMTQELNKGTHWYEVAIPSDRRNTGGAAVLIPKSIGEVMPFRWCEVEGYPGTLTADKIRQVAVHYPFNDEASAFTSSSKTLNDVWELCKYSIKATSFLGVYVDGDRERIPYEGDAYINQLGHYCVDREYSMARYSLEYLIDHPTWPVEWQQHIPLMAWEDYLYTGDDSLLKRRYTDIAAKTLQPLAGGDGLLAIDKRKMSKAFLKSINIRRQIRTLVDWPRNERDGHKIVTVDAVVNAFNYRNLLLLSRIAKAIGKEDDAASFEAEAKKVYNAYQKVFFDHKKGIYRDGKGVKHSSLHANMFPLAFGLVPKEHRASVLTFIRSRGMACSVYAAQHLLDGLYRYEDGEYALKLLTSKGDRSWAHMIYDVGSTISLEAWDNKYKSNQDWNHAWGAAPANLIPRGLMGIQPIEPGCRRMRIKPQIGNLEYASIKCPTIRGTIHMEIKQDKNTYRVKLRIPANMTVDLHLPTNDPSRISMLAGLTDKPKQLHDKTVIELQGGQYDFEVRK